MLCYVMLLAFPIFDRSLSPSVPEIFAIEVQSCPQSRRILHVFCPPKF